MFKNPFVTFGVLPQSLPRQTHSIAGHSPYPRWSLIGHPHIRDGASSLGISISQTEPRHWAFPMSQTEPRCWASPCPRRSLVAGRPHVPDGASLLVSPADDGATPPACRSRFLSALPSFTNVPFAVPSAVSSTHSPDCCQHALSFC